jgi:hypothetical protein
MLYDSFTGGSCGSEHSEAKALSRIHISARAQMVEKVRTAVKKGFVANWSMTEPPEVEVSSNRRRSGGFGGSGINHRSNK